jgi:ribosomal protein L40E
VEINGSYESARVNIGNQISGNVQTNKSVINIESMTLRVWVSEIDTVIFGKDAPRQLIGMRGLPNAAQELAGTLKGFGEARSMVVAPTATQDLERAQRIGVMNQLIDGSSFELPSAENTAVIAKNQNAEQAAQLLPAVGTVLAYQFCTGCGASLDVNARFCEQCGTPVGR